MSKRARSKHFVRKKCSPQQQEAGKDSVQSEPVQCGRKEYYPFLDGFRALAILIILAHHMRRSLDLDNWFSSASDQPIFLWIHEKMLNSFGMDLTTFYDWMQWGIGTMKGVLGVEMFFVISGFLITRILFGDGSREFSCWHFYQRRFFRIYPAYLLMVLVSLGIFFGQNPEPFSSMVATIGRYLLLLQNYYLRNPFLEHTWSMVVTEQFYILCPLVLLLVFALTPSVRARRNILIGFCLLILLIAPSIRICYLDTGHAPWEWPFRAPFPFLTTLYNIEAIVFGCLMAFLEPFICRWKRSKWWGIAFWIAGVGGFAYLSFALYWDYFYGAWYLYTCGYLASGALIIAAYHGVSLFARMRSLQWLGRHSYGIYLWHYLPLYFWALWLGKLPLTVIILGFLLSSVLLGIVSTKTVERYFLSWRERLVPKSAELQVIGSSPVQMSSVNR